MVMRREYMEVTEDFSKKRVEEEDGSAAALWRRIGHTRLGRGCAGAVPPIELCGISTGINELEVDGLPVNVGIGIVSLFLFVILTK